jgi:phthiocerol/phenolphthiocerol synthesis type-I polyketide synthase C
LNSLDAALATPTPRLGFLDFEWSVLKRFLPSAQSPKFGGLARQDAAGSAGRDTTQDLRQRLTELPESELLPAVVDFVRGEIAQILRIAPERIDASASLFDMGMDSLMAVELATSIEGRLGTQLSALALSDAPTIERIAARLAQQLRPSAAEPAATGHENTMQERILLAAAQHASEISQDDAVLLSAEMKSDAVQMSLTAGRSR